MAQTKTRSKPKARASGAKAKKTNARGNAKASSRSKPKAASEGNSKATPSKPKAVVETVEETAKDAGRTVGRAASKAKVPLMAGGAALAGAAGGLALGARQAHRHRGFKGSLRSMDSGDLAKAARKVGDFSAQIGELALEARRAREAANGKNRSPIEVVLDGLTARRNAGRR